MVIVRVILRPRGDASQDRVIAEAEITNDATGTEELGNYVVKLGHCGDHYGRPGVWRRGKVTGFLRSMSPFHLVLRALEACLRTL